MIKIRHSAQRGHSQLGWLDAKHSFTFADFHDPEWMRFRSLRVINEDWIEAGAGFPMHPHRDMEIITWVVQGAVAHEDSTGRKGLSRPDELQTMSAGTGILHSEFNNSKTEPLHLYQIWMEPHSHGVKPAYGHAAFDRAGRNGKLQLIASPDGRDGSLAMSTDVDVYAGAIKDSIRFHPRPGRGQWLQVVAGGLTVNDTPVRAGDGVAIEDETAFRLVGGPDAEVLLFDLA